MIMWAMLGIFSVKSNVSSHSGRPHWKHSSITCGGFLRKDSRQVSSAFQLKICQSFSFCSFFDGSISGHKRLNDFKLSATILSFSFGQRSESARARRWTNPMSPKLSTTLQRIVMSKVFSGKSVTLKAIKIFYAKYQLWTIFFVISDVWFIFSERNWISYQKKRVNSPCWAYKVSDCAIFLQKLLAIAQNSSVAAFFFFPLIQFMNSE